MSNKINEKLDGVIDIPSEKPAVNPKPARPPKPKKPLARETKVGLGVIAALLVIFVVVLIVRLQGGSGEQVAQTQTSSADRADIGKSNKSENKASPADSRTVLAAKSGAGTESQYWPGPPSGQPGGAGSNSVHGGSVYGSRDTASDQRGPQPGYLPPSTAADTTPVGAGSYDSQNLANDDPAVDNPLRLGQDNGPQSPTQNVTDGSALPTRSADPFSSQYKLGAARTSLNDSREPIPTDETGADNSAATQADSALDSPFNNEPIAGFNRDISASFKNDASGPSSRGGFDSQQDSKSHSATAVNTGPNAFERTTASDAELSEAERFVPNALRSSEGAAQMASDDSGTTVADDQRELANPEKVNAGAGKLRPVDGFEFGRAPQKLANQRSPFGAPKQPAGAPAPLNDAIIAEQGQPPAPLPTGGSFDAAETYAVATDDTYWTIAKKTYGSGAYFKALYEHNRRRLDDADALRPGMQLILPDEATLQRLYPALCPRPQKLAAASRVTRASANFEAGGRAYVVNEGDTLYEVARRQLGKASRWAEVYELNRDAIGAATDRLEPGTRLVLPRNQ